MLWITILFTICLLALLVYLAVGNPCVDLQGRVREESREPVRQVVFWSASGLIIALLLFWGVVPERFPDFGQPYLPFGSLPGGTVLNGALLLLLLGVAVAFAPPKTMAVAQAAYRETIRQPLFWILLLLAMFFMFLSTFIPYFTLGEDLKMVKDLELDMILVPTLIVTIFTTSVSIAEEIEGRTAITLLSKPVARRQFLLGKYFGVLMAAGLMVLILTVFMSWTINYKIDMDHIDRPPDSPEIASMTSALEFLPGVVVQGARYVALIFADLQGMAPGVVLSFCQVAILTSIAVALATRLPMVVNVVVCIAIFAMGHLTHVLQVISADNKLVNFVAQIFATILPGLNYFNVGPAIVGEVNVPWGGYVLPALIHGVIFTLIALLLGLILFEDRDLA